MFKSAIIGCGIIGKVHAEVINNLENVNVKALCDIDEEKAKEVCSLVPDAKIYTDYSEILKDENIDVVHICTPHYLHADMAIKAMESEKEVFLEKPAAMNYTEALKIIECSEKTGKKVCVCFQNRLNTANLLLKQILDSEKYGKLKGLNGIVLWHRDKEYYDSASWRGRWETEGGGVLINQAIHTLDLMYYFGGKIKKTQGSVDIRTNKGFIEVEDTAEATLYFENGAVGCFYATNCSVCDNPVQIDAICEKARFSIRDNVLYISENSSPFTPIAANGNEFLGKACYGNGHSSMIGAFYDALSGKDAFYCDIRDAVQVLKVIDEIYAYSAKKLR